MVSGAVVGVVCRAMMIIVVAVRVVQGRTRGGRGRHDVCFLLLLLLLLLRFPAGLLRPVRQRNSLLLSLRGALSKRSRKEHPATKKSNKTSSLRAKREREREICRSLRAGPGIWGRVFL